jgi:hypothetical protein
VGYFFLGPGFAVKSAATRNSPLVTVSGNMGRLAVAGQPMTLPPADGSNSEWWQKHAISFLSASQALTSQP